MSNFHSFEVVGRDSQVIARYNFKWVRIYYYYFFIFFIQLFFFTLFITKQLQGYVHIHIQIQDYIQTLIYLIFSQ